MEPKQFNPFLRNTIRIAGALVALLLVVSQSAIGVTRASASPISSSGARGDDPLTGYLSGTTFEGDGVTTYTLPGVLACVFNYDSYMGGSILDFFGCHPMDGSGSYLVGPLPVGDYLVWLQNPSGHVYEYFYETVELTSAMRVTVTDGNTTTDIDFTHEPNSVGFITDSNGIADLSWNWLGYQGLLQAEADMGVVGTLYEPGPGADEVDYEAAFTACVNDGNILCIGSGWMLQTAMETVAAINPGVNFAILDIALDGAALNTRGLIFASDEAGYLAGALAGAMTTTDFVGDIGGMEIQPVIDFTEGFHNGVQCANTDAVALMDYIGNFYDAGAGAAMAEEMITMGADVVFAAAGPAGRGGILYSSSEDVWSIGVDFDEYVTTFGSGSVPGAEFLLTSAMKNLDVAVYQTILDQLNGTFTFEDKLFNLENGGVGLAPYHETDSIIPEGVKLDIENLRQDIIDGFVDVDETCRPGYGWFNAWYGWDGVHGYGFPMGSKVYLTVDDPVTPENPDYESFDIVHVAPWDSSGTAVEFALHGIVDLVPGLEISMTDHFVTKTQTLVDVQVVTVDVDLDTISGTAPAGMYMDVNAGDSHRRTSTNEFGDWSVDFSMAGTEPDETIADIVPGSNGAATALDEESDGSGRDWRVLAPYIEVNPHDHWIHAREWAEGVVVTLTIDDPSNGPGIDHVDTATMVQAPWNLGDPNDIVANFDWPGIGLEPGFIVHMTGTGGDKTMTMMDLSIFEAEEVLDTVAGFAELDIQVQVCANIPGGCVFRYPQSDEETGEFIAEFGIPGVFPDDLATVDLQPGSDGWAQVYDEDQDRIMANWRVLSPVIQASPHNQWIDAREWPEGTELTLTIDDPSTGVGVDYTDLAIIEANPDNPGDPNDIRARFDWPLMGLEEGFILVVDDLAGTAKTLVISGFRVNTFDLVLDTISGEGTPGGDVEVCVNQPVDCVHHFVIPDISTGEWVADYGNPGVAPDDLETVDLEPGMNGWASEMDGDGDKEIWDWNIPNPNIAVRAQFGDSVEAYSWPLGSTVDLWINNPSNGPFLDYEASGVMGVAPWDPNETYYNFDLNGVYDIQPGDFVYVSNVFVERSLVVSDLAFTGMDVDQDLITGIANPGADVDVWACDEVTCTNRFTVANGSGDWNVDFTDPDIHGNPAMDLQIGNWVDSQEWDMDHLNRTMFGRNIPNTHIEAEVWANSVTAYDFLPNQEILIEVDDPSTGLNPDFSQSVMADGGGWATFNPTPALEAGFEIVASDGVNVRTLIVSQLHGTADEFAEIVYGIATPNAEVSVWVDAFDTVGAEYLTVPVDGAGEFVADFSGIYDLHVWNFGGLSEADADGDTTFYQWRVVHPTVEAWVSENMLKIWDWPLGADLTISLDDPTTISSPDYVTHEITVESPYFEGSMVWVPLYTNFFLTPDTIVTVDGGGVVDGMTVSAISITNIDVDLDTVSGVTEANTDVLVQFYDHGALTTVTSDGDGIWTADFAGVLDIQYGMVIWVSVRDSDMDGTFYETSVGSPFACLPGDTIQGNIFALDDFTSVANAIIYFDDFFTDTAMFQANTAPDGSYACAGLPDGSYRIWASAGLIGSLNFSRSYYPDNIYESADEVIVSGSTQLTDVNMTFLTPFGAYIHLDFNFNRAITAELAVRQAFAYGIDRQTILDEVATGKPLMDSFIGPGYWPFASAGVPHYEYNPAYAAFLLSEAGWLDSADPDTIREKGGVSLILDLVIRSESNRVRAAEIIQENMAEIGVGVNILIVPNFGEYLASGDFDLTIFGWSYDENNDFGTGGIWGVYETGSPSNSGGYSNSTVDSLLSAILPLRTRAEVLPLLTDIQVEVMSDLATLPLYNMMASPAASAGPDRTVLEDIAVTLDGSATTDGYRDIVSYEWDLDNDGDFDDASGITPEVVFDTGGTFVVTLKVTDAYSLVSVDSATIIVTPVPAPAAFGKYYPSNGAVNRSTATSLTWLASARTWYYEFCIDTEDNDLCDSEWVDVGLNRNVPLSGLAGNTTYYWQVLATNGNGTEAANAGDWWSFTTIACYSLATPVNPAGLGSVNVNLTPNCAGGLYSAGTSLQLTPVANYGYGFSSWSGDGSGTTVPLVVNMTRNKTVTANFTPLCYFLNLSVEPAGLGSVTANPAPNCAGGKYLYNTSVELTSTAVSGYMFRFWSGDLTGSNNPETVVIDGDLTIVANIGVLPPGTFAKFYPSDNAVGRSTATTLSWLSSARATSYEYCIDTSDNDVCNTSWVNTGMVRNAPLTNLAGNTDYYWQVRAVNAADEKTYGNGGDWWHFTTVPCYSLTVLRNPTTGGTVTNDGVPNCAGGLYAAGTVLHLTGVPGSGITFLFWKGDASTTVNPLTVTMTKNKTITATFSAASDFGLYYPLDGAVGRSTVTTLSWLTSTRAVRYEYCIDESDNNICDTTWINTGATRNAPLSGLKGLTTYFWQVRAVNSTGILTEANYGDWWSFTTIGCYSLTTLVNPGGSGHINVDKVPNCAGGLYSAGTVLLITGVPESGFNFANWSGDGSGIVNPLSVTMSRNKTITGNFTP